MRYYFIPLSIFLGKSAQARVYETLEEFQELWDESDRSAINEQKLMYMADIVLDDDKRILKCRFPKDSPQLQNAFFGEYDGAIVITPELLEIIYTTNNFSPTFTAPNF